MTLALKTDKRATAKSALERRLIAANARAEKAEDELARVQAILDQLVAGFLEAEEAMERAASRSPDGVMTGAWERAARKLRLLLGAAAGRSWSACRASSQVAE